MRAVLVLVIVMAGCGSKKVDEPPQNVAAPPAAAADADPHDALWRDVIALFERLADALGAASGCDDAAGRVHAVVDAPGGDANLRLEAANVPEDHALPPDQQERLGAAFAIVVGWAERCMDHAAFGAAIDRLGPL